MIFFHVKTIINGVKHKHNYIHIGSLCVMLYMCVREWYVCDTIKTLKYKTKLYSKIAMYLRIDIFYGETIKMGWNKHTYINTCTLCMLMCMCVGQCMTYSYIPCIYNLLLSYCFRLTELWYATQNYTSCAMLCCSISSLLMNFLIYTIQQVKSVSSSYISTMLYLCMFVRFSLHLGCGFSFTFGFLM